MKWLVLVSLILIISQIQAYPQKDDFVNDEVEVEHKSDTQLAEEKLFAYAQILKGMMKPSSVRAHLGTAPSPHGFLSSHEDIEHMEGENLEVDGIQQMADEIADHQTNALCIDPDQCNCKLKYQVDTKQETTNGVVTADCWLINIPYCEGPCHGVFKYVMVLYNVTVIIYF